MPHATFGTYLYFKNICCSSQLHLSLYILNIIWQPQTAGISLHWSEGWVCFHCIQLINQGFKKPALIHWPTLESITQYRTECNSLFLGPRIWSG